MRELKDYPTGNVTFVFTDIERSTPMTGRLELHGLDLYQTKLQGPQRKLLEEWDKSGFEIQRAGDGHMFVFQKTADALACAVAFQKSLHDKPISHREGGETFTIRVRVGIHTAVIQRDSVSMKDRLVEYPGNDTNFASRVMSQGRGGQILLSESAATQAESLKLYRLHRWPNRRLKGFEEKPRASTNSSITMVKNRSNRACSGCPTGMPPRSGCTSSGPRSRTRPSRPS